MSSYYSRLSLPTAFLLLVLLYLCVMLMGSGHMDTFTFKENIRKAIKHSDAKRHKDQAIGFEGPIDDDFLEDVPDVLHVDKGKDNINDMEYQDLPDFMPEDVIFGDNLNAVDEAAVREKVERGKINPEDLGANWGKDWRKGKIAFEGAFNNGMGIRLSKEELKEEAAEKEKNRPSYVYEVSKDKKYGAIPYPEYVEEEVPNGPGWKGGPYEINLKNLTKEEKDQKKEAFDINYFDEWVNKAISVHRNLPDGRSVKCKAEKFGPLPAVSVLIVFHNEAWSTLLRTVYSVLQQSPPGMLQEIVVLDDYSDLPFLADPIEKYFQAVPKVRFLRAKERIGLILGRNELFRQAKGEIVVFLDSHIECFPGWLEPLVAPIVKNNRTVVYPNIEMINPGTFQTGEMDYPNAVGGFDFDKLNFNWLYGRKLDRTVQKPYIDSPTMPGGLYAISSQWFRTLGMYDEGMKVWGVENLEISFKVWMCGGTIVLSACSHVGHVFRRRNPNMVGQRVGYRNHVRLAEVWMDKYKHHFYEEQAYTLGEFGDVTDRKNLRRSLQCKPFSWYLFKIIPEIWAKLQKYGVMSGLIKNDKLGLCMDSTKVKGYVRLVRCAQQSRHQYWRMSQEGVLQSGDYILGMHEATESTKEIFKLWSVGEKSNVKKAFTYEKNGKFVHTGTGKCLQADRRLSVAMLQDCDDMNLYQSWNMTTRDENQRLVRNSGLDLNIAWDDAYTHVLH